MTSLTARFTQAMQAFEPFEPAPHLVVAVSGGADSLSLCLLAHQWAFARGGQVTALTVDHQLRTESLQEARQVGAWLQAKAIAHVVLPWCGPKPASAIQEEARHVRYRLLEDWCEEHHVLHLLVGHHLDDQLETITMRSARHSGPVGLAGMSAVREMAHARLLRPLLGVPKSSLQSWLQAQGQDWLEDPSNQSDAYARNRIRQDAIPYQLSDAIRFGKARVALEAEVADAFAAQVRWEKKGYYVSGTWRGCAEEVQMRLWLALLQGVSPKSSLLRQEKLRTLLARMQRPGWKAATLHGCQLRKEGDGVRVVREEMVEMHKDVSHIKQSHPFGCSSPVFLPVNALLDGGEHGIDKGQMT